MSAGASQVCMITGIAETMAITMMVTASSLAIASRLCPLLIRAIQFGYRALHTLAVFLRSVHRQNRKKQRQRVRSLRSRVTNYVCTGSVQRTQATGLVSLGFENKIHAFRFAARDGDILGLRSVGFMPC